MRSIQNHLSEFEQRGVRVVGISVDPAEVTRTNCEKLGYTYTFLSDHGREVIHKYDLTHAAPGMGDIARPAEFLIDSRGVVRWRNLSNDLRIRMRPQQVFAALDQLGKG